MGQNPYRLAERTCAEDLFVWRKCRGLTQRQAAAARSIGRRQYQSQEAGDAEIEKPPALPKIIPLVVLNALARRRAGLSTAEAAKEMGVSRMTFLRYEREEPEKVRKFWQSKKYSFWQ